MSFDRISPNVCPDLLYKVEADPFNIEARQELAGALRPGNPRGAFIAEQCKPESEQDPELINRLLAEHGRKWTAQDLGINESDIPEGATVAFHQGFAWLPVKAKYQNFQAAIDAGNYESVDRFITAANYNLEDAPVSIRSKLVLYQPNRPITSPRAIYELRRLLRLHLDADQIWELCAIGATYPNIQCHFAVASLGFSLVNSCGRRDVAFLHDWGHKRGLDLSWFDYKWDHFFHFLATRKQFSNPGTVIV